MILRCYLQTQRRRVFMLFCASTFLANCSPGSVADDSVTQQAFGRASDFSRVEGLKGPATIRWTTGGIPHIVAANEHDVFFLTGWVHAQDRLFSMDVLRRLANGTLAELFGAPALATDVELRTLGLRRAAEKSASIQAPPVLAALKAYSAGINAYVAEYGLPTEYAFLEITEFDPWTFLDSLAAANAVVFDLNFSVQDIVNTINLQTFIAVGTEVGFDGTALYSDLFRSASFSKAATVKDALGLPLPTPQTTSSKPHHGAGIAVANLGRRYLRRISHVTGLKELIHRDGKGSNVWILDGRYSKNGRPLFAADPHFGLGAPATLYQVAQRAPNLDAIGASVPAFPMLIFGQNRHVIWGETANQVDLTDIFQETVVADPDSPTGLSIVHRGNNEPILAIPQEFRFNVFDGEPNTIAIAPPDEETDGIFVPGASLIVSRRNNGPIIDLDLDAGVALSVQFTGLGATRDLEAFYRISRAKSVYDCQTASEYFDGGSLNFMCADSRGNISFSSGGEIPLREDLQAGAVEGLPPYFIRNGSAGNEWIPQEGPTSERQSLMFQILPANEMARVINPPAGFIVNANNDPEGLTVDNDPLNEVRSDGGIKYVSDNFPYSFRAARINQMLKDAAKSGPLTVEDLKRMQADTKMLDASVFVPYLLSAFDHAASSTSPILAELATNPALAEAVQRLRQWDYSTPTGIAQGYDADDRNGVLGPPSVQEIAHSISTTIYTLWREQFVANTIDRTLASVGISLEGDIEAARTLATLRYLLEDFPNSHGIGTSGLDFFTAPNVSDRDVARDVVLLVSLEEALERLASAEFAAAFAESTDQEDYRWGKLHRLVLEHPLGSPFDIPPAGGALPPPLPGLVGFPLDGRV